MVSGIAGSRPPRPPLRAFLPSFLLFSACVRNNKDDVGKNETLHNREVRETEREGEGCSPSSMEMIRQNGMECKFRNGDGGERVGRGSHSPLSLQPAENEINSAILIWRYLFLSLILTSTSETLHGEV